MVTYSVFITLSDCSATAQINYLATGLGAKPHHRHVNLNCKHILSL